MKFLGWMRHKFCENNKEPLKDVTTGNDCFRLSTHSSLDGQDIYITSVAGSRCNTGIIRQIQESSFPGSTDNTEENFDDEMISELFHGFLAIGTLGREPAVDEPATPTFGMSLENPIEENAEVTENDLKLISDELEKFLEAEAEEGHDQQSGRNSDTNTIASTIKPIEGAKEDSKTMIFPLQGYLFGSSIELPETKIGATRERASLGELFQRTKMQENVEDKHRNKVLQTNPTHRSAKHLMTKLLKKVHSSSRFSAGGKTDSPSTKEKFQKIIQIFHRKVHPENSVTEREINSKMTNAESKEPYSLGLVPKKGNSSNKMAQRRIQYEIKGSDSARTGEHWIKTDAEYFVLEL